MEYIDVLLVEDDINDAELVLHALRKNNMPSEVLVVEDGKEALDYLLCRGAYAERDESHPPKLILLDLKLPHVSGHEVLKSLKENERTRLIPVVILTSSDLDYDITKGYQLGVNSYIQKPVEFDEFEQAVRLIGQYWLGLNKVAVV